MTEVDGEVLDKIWYRYASARGFDPRTVRSYQRESRRSLYGRAFEAWLFNEGAIVQQRNKRRFIAFVDDTQASFFLLKWGL